MTSGFSGIPENVEFDKEMLTIWGIQKDYLEYKEEICL